VYAGFPVAAVSLLRCSWDSGRLAIRSDAGESPTLWSASLQCLECQRHFPVQDGIVRLLDASLLDPESDHERTVRDLELEAAFVPDDERSEFQLAEILPMLEACEPLENATVLELGAGSGRHTMLIAGRSGITLAVDFSIVSLRHLAARAHDGWTLGLVHADCTRVVVERRAFDVILSTLVSNLPTAQHRAAMMRLAADALTPEGKFVFGTHYYGLHSRIRGEQRSGRYKAGGIYRYLFGRREIEVETRRFFGRVASRPIQIVLPLSWRLKLPLLKLSRFAERVPLLNQFGELLLVVARSAHRSRG
jgi:SAM-dependent methyltransferase